MRVVDHHVARLDRRDLRVQRTFRLAPVHVCEVAEFEELVALDETELASRAVSERDYWLRDGLGAIDFCKDFLCRGQHMHHSFVLSLLVGTISRQHPRRALNRLGHHDVPVGLKDHLVVTRLLVEEQKVLSRVVDQTVCVVEANFESGRLLADLDVHVQFSPGFVLHQQRDFLFFVDQLLLSVEHK